jgi:hypothetical protein
MPVGPLEVTLFLTATTIDISALSYTKDSGWDGAKACLLNTRKLVIDNILAWVHAKDISGSEQVYLVADVVGSGKTALAHTIAERCFEDGVLVSSFFFDQKAGWTSPRDFLCTLARDLGSRSGGVAQLISVALRKEPGLVVSLPISRFFEQLIMKPVTSCHLEGPIVVVVDALDESDAEELLDILRSGVPRLPGNFRFFVTSRPESNVLRRLIPDIQPHEIGIHEAENLEDIVLYIGHRLTEIALDNDLPNWPSEVLFEKFVEKAEGLFIWVATVCEYLLGQATYPDEMLERLLESLPESRLPPEQKMDSLYSMILARCAWDDDRFVEGYQQVMGVIVAAKEPMLLTTLQAIHGPESRMRVKAILRPIGSVVTGLTVSNPIRILHTSFREFITRRASRPHHIRAKEHSARLAILCIRILCDLFSVAMTGTGFLSDLSSGVDKRSIVGIPDVEADSIPDEGWYAIKFWPAHIVKVAKPDEEIVEMLYTFFSQHLITWVEVVTSKESYTSLTSVRRWLRVSTMFFLR